MATKIKTTEVTEVKATTKSKPAAPVQDAPHGLKKDGTPKAKPGRKTPAAG